MNVAAVFPEGDCGGNSIKTRQSKNLHASLSQALVDLRNQWHGRDDCPKRQASSPLQNELQPYLLTMIRTCAELQTDLRAKGGIEGFGTSTSGAEAVIPQNDISQKVHLERLIAKERRIGTYTFDEAKQCFVADSEVGLYITKIGDAKYRFICYFIDGHEVPLNESETKEFAGDEDAAKQQAIDSFNQETFLGHPIVFPNISCGIYEDEV